MKKLFVYGFCLLSLNLNLFANGNKNIPLYKDAKVPIEKRIDDLLSRMTIEEKVSQLNQYTLGRNSNINNVGDEVKNLPAEIGSLIYFNADPLLRNQVQHKAMEESRLGIPIIFAFDVIHGFRTVYQISLGQACSWNPKLVEQACLVAAQESRMSGIDWTFSPMIDVARDGRWGRVAEGYGEDPYTNAVFGVASVKGYQGNNMNDGNRVAACLKHYVGYGASEGGRDYVYTEISPQTLWDTYLPPYEACVKAGAATLMSSFNDISGIPGSANQYTLTEILKKRWEHDGFVVSDWGAIEQLRSQGVAANREEASSKAIIAGVEMDMMNGCYDKYLVKLVNEGKVSESRLNDAVKRVLRIKFRLGLFEQPFTPIYTEKDRLLKPESFAVAKKIGEESIVLLKNNNNILPLTQTSKIAVIGPMAQNREHLLGSWAAHGSPEDVTSIYDGLKSEFGVKSSLSYAKGCDFDGTDTIGFSEARSVAKVADVVVICIGEKRGWSGENASRSTLALPQIQEELVREIKKLGKPIVLLLSNGRPLELNKLEPICDAIVEMWQPGVVGGIPVAEVISGKINPSGKLSMTFPYSTGQIPIYYNMRQSARPAKGKYKDIPTTALYEFAYGLSYTSYQYADLKASNSSIKRTQKLTIEIPVTNTGARDGDETVHWYISDPYCSISRPIKELKYFEKQQIKSGETKIFHFELDPMRDLSFVDGNGTQFLEKGDYYIIVKDKKIKIEVTD